MHTPCLLHSSKTPRALPRLTLPAFLALIMGCTTITSQSGTASQPTNTTPAQVPAVLANLLPADAILLGEQHDAPEHHALELASVQTLAAHGQLTAVLIEMAESGRSTRSLGPTASAQQVQEALQWNDKAWPWKAYGPAIMAAQAAGIPVLGANLPRSEMAAAMKNSQLDAHLPATQQQRLINAIDTGHCGLLPQSQWLPMARVQIARDASMAKTLISTAQAGKTVLVIAGRAHVDRAQGIPTHLPPQWRTRVIVANAQNADASPANPPEAADIIWHTPARPSRDYCAELKSQRPPQAPSVP